MIIYDTLATADVSCVILKTFFFKKDIMVCEEVRIDSYGFTPITAMAIIYICSIYCSTHHFIFNFFYCYYIILEKYFLGLRGKKRHLKKKKMAEECRRESR